MIKMADYIAMVLSTSFRVKDIDKFMEGLEKVIMEEVSIDVENDTVQIHGYSPIPNYIEIDDDYENFDFIEYIHKHIKEGEKMRITEIGYEKLRYLQAIAYDITSKYVKYIDASVS